VAVRKQVGHEDAGRSMATLMRQLGGLVQGLWMTRDRDVITFWVLTCPLETDTQLTLYEHSAALYDELPGIVFEIHVLNPAWFAEGDALSALPPDAQSIPLPAA
jgi:hypothetical protein